MLRWNNRRKVWEISLIMFFTSTLVFYEIIRLWDPEIPQLPGFWFVSIKRITTVVEEIVARLDRWWKTSISTLFAVGFNSWHWECVLHFTVNLWHDTGLVSSRRMLQAFATLLFCTTKWYKQLQFIASMSVKT